MAENGGVTLEGVTKTFPGGTRAVDAVSLAIAEGEFFSLLGPSGCGKTTTLRMIAGFEAPDAGRIRVRGADITALPPEKRNMGMVFQNYALFPHRTVAENVAFGLRMRNVPKADIAARVRQALAMVRLEGLEDRRPAQLSGGQQQRVALARAIVVNPTVLLCDEPLGALDKKLRQAMQFELKELHRRLGLTLVYVTHDQEEALTMSDRIAVMRAGRIAQLGTPREIYDRPTSRFVADFIGDTNILDGEPREGGLAMPGGWVSPVASLPPGVRAIALRPEQVRLTAAGGGIVDATVEEANFLGDSMLLKLGLPAGVALLARVPRDADPALTTPGSRAGVSWRPEDPVPLADA
ncbi:MAG: ABC transporter ATP-binding protein [Acetobacteraceae bacterium]|nr:ABC transporter ATP-binding protein [Acetobacteraceae bacterium]MCX7685847.1 ABC transporter ATP-binding protein [Acetobacteraceae bacterium]MDW8397177.1 ABC transporter ATP-binding protein [Acetobacteraceae bacterium]